MRYRWLGVAALVCASAASAQEIGENDFLAGGTRDDAALRALGAELAEAQAGLQGARALPNPRVEFWREQPEPDARVTNWTLSWAPPLDGRRGLARRAAEAGVAAARERAVLDAAALRRELRQAFAAWSLAVERRQVVERHWERVRALAEAERHRARVGETSGLAARRLTLAEIEVRAALGAAEAEQARAHAVARAWRPGLGPDAFPARVAPAEPAAAPDPGETPEVRAARLDAQRAAFERRRAGRVLGAPTVQVGWQRLVEGGGARGGPILAAGWTIPLFDRDQGARFLARRREEIAAARVELARARVAAEVAGHLAAQRRLSAAWRDAGRVGDETERVIAASEAAFRAGEVPLVDLLDSLRAALSARLAEIDLRAQALHAQRELEAVLGRTLDEGGR